MKDGLDQTAVARLRAALCAGDAGFDGLEFERRAMKGLRKLELKERVAHLISAINEGLPDDFTDALPVVLAAGNAFPAGDPTDSLNGFAAWPLIDWVAVYGLDHFDESMAALRRLTPLFSAEFAVRPFINADPVRALAIMNGWLGDGDEHVRRLVSEGSRALLPWGVQLPVFRRDPAPVLVLLEQLKNDPSEYVRRSVANNLNDISKDHPKDHPKVVVAIARKWWKSGSSERRGLVRHGLRTLVKKGDAGALRVLGFTTDPKVAVELVLSAETLAIGGSLNLNLTLQSTGGKTQKLVVDYVVHHQRARGKVTTKVFKWRNLDLSAGETVSLVKKHSFVPRSVRRLYPGTHRIEVLVGGRVMAGKSFELTEPR